MKLKQFFTEDDGVSPVIGVILMVAITVILAAVIASFVLGLGDAADEVQPNTNFAFDYTQGENVTITLTDGEAIDEDEIVLRGDGLDDSYVGADDEIDGIDGTWNVGGSVTVGNNGDFGTLEAGGDLNVVWEESGGDSAATLATFEVPEDH